MTHTVAGTTTVESILESVYQSVCLKCCHSFTLPSRQVDFRQADLLVYRWIDWWVCVTLVFGKVSSDLQNTHNNTNTLTDRCSSRPAFCEVKWACLSTRSDSVEEISSAFSSVSCWKWLCDGKVKPRQHSIYNLHLNRYLFFRWLKTFLNWPQHLFHHTGARPSWCTECNILTINKYLIESLFKQIELSLSYEHRKNIYQPTL